MPDTYLLCWNPKVFHWIELEAEARAILEGRAVDGNWSCGVTRRIQVGDRLFLLRQGVEPRGIIASGWAVSTPYEEPHWDEERAERGDVALFVSVRFDTLLNPEMGDEPLALAKLRTGLLAAVNWTPQASGMQIRQGADELERLWAEHLQRFGNDPAPVSELTALEGAIRIDLRRHRVRERWLREVKLDDYKRKHGGRLPCEVCGFDFFEAYDEIGRDFAHVHHLKPLGDRTRPSQTNLEDLAVVCANCHAMIHSGGVTRPLVGLLKSPASL